MWRGDRDATWHRPRHAHREMADVVVSVDDLQRVHLHHLRHGAAGVAAGIETVAALREVEVDALVAEIERLAEGTDSDIAGWASLVLPLVRAASDAGELHSQRPGAVGQPRSQR